MSIQNNVGKKRGLLYEVRISRMSIRFGLRHFYFKIFIVSKWK